MPLQPDQEENQSFINQAIEEAYNHFTQQTDTEIPSTLALINDHGLQGPLQTVVMGSFHPAGGVPWTERCLPEDFEGDSEEIMVRYALESLFAAFLFLTPAEMTTLQSYFVRSLAHYLAHPAPFLARVEDVYNTATLNYVQATAPAPSPELEPS